MKAILSLIGSLLFSTIILSQSFYSSFNDGTLQGWTNTDGTTTSLTVEDIPPNIFLHKECDGSNSPIGEMTIINTTEWIGNYFYFPTGVEEYMRNVDEIYLKNDNDFDLHLRYGFTGANGYMVVTTDPIIIPAFSDWDFYEQHYSIEFPGIYNLTILNDTTGLPFLEVFNNVHELFEDVVEFRIFHNEDITLDGQIVNGTLQIDDIMSIELLSNGEQEESNVELFPNPVKDILKIKLPNASTGNIVIFNVLGENVLSGDFSSRTMQIDLSKLKSGIYLVRIQTENQSTIKKIVKL